MAPSDFYLFPKLKFHRCGKPYGSNEGVIEAVNEYLGTRKKDSIRLEGIRTLKQRWAKCIVLEGDYIKKRWSHLHSLASLSTKGYKPFYQLSYIQNTLQTTSVKCYTIIFETIRFLILGYTKWF